MAQELAGKVAIITGGANGIGAASVELFVEEGAKVVIADLNVEAGTALAKRLGDDARFFETDVSDRASVDALVDFAIDTYGDLDIMFNNAGFSGKFTNRFLDDPIPDFDKVLNVNLAGVLYGCHAAARHMAKQRKGSIINTSSIGGIAPSYALLTYRAAKAGVVNLTKSLAIDLGEYLIRVNGIAPGHIPTAMNPFMEKGLSADRQAVLDAKLEAVREKSQPLKRRSAPIDIAQMAMFLGSDRSRQVTGQVIAVDGGITAGDVINLNGLLGAAKAEFLAGER